MPPKPNSAVKQLQQQNYNIRKEMEKLKQEFGTMQDSLKTHEAAASNGGQGTDKETLATLEFMGQEYDDLTSFRAKAMKDLAAMNSRLQSLCERMDEMDTALDELVNYSYGFNVKLIGVPELDPDSKESAKETSKLCVKIFNKMGAVVSLNDIDIAHRVPNRSSATNQPKPIICKFVRRLARDEVMFRRKEISSVDPSDVGLRDSANFGGAVLLDHLSPKIQALLYEAKKFKARFSYAFCWTKNATVYLRHDESSRVIKVKDMAFLQDLIHEELEALS